MPAQSTEIESIPVPYEVETWTIRDGLPQSEVTALQQAADGSLWVATYGGLARFDGLRFQVFDLSARPGRWSSRLTALCDTGDALWIGTSSDGLVRLQSHRLTEFDEGLPAREVTALFEDSGNRLWIGTIDGLAWMEGDRIHRLDGVAGPVTALAESPAGRLWFTNQGNVLQLQHGEVRQLREGLDGVEYLTVFAASDGSVFAGANNASVTRWRDGAPPEGIELPLGESVGAITEDRDGAIWFGTSAGPIRWYRDRFENPLAHHDPPLKTQSFDTAALVDREGNVWFGGRHGLRKLRPTPFTGVRLSTSYGNSVRTVAADERGRIWAALQDGTLLRWDRGQVTDVSAGGGPRAESMALARDGALLTASEEGLWRLPRGSEDFEEIPIEAAKGPRWALLEDRHGDLWVTAAGDLWRLGSDGTTSYHPQDKVLGGVIVSLLESRRGGVWVGGDGGLCRVEDDHVARLWRTGHELPAGVVRALYEDDAGFVWVGTIGGGLCRVSRDGVPVTIGKLHGLYEGVVSRIVDAGDGNVLLQGNRALSLVSLAEIQAVADGTRRRVYPRVFAAGPGVGTFEGMGGATPLQCRAPDGSLWFPALEGLVRFDPSAITPVEVTPQVVIEAVIVDGRDYRVGDAIELPPGQHDLEFHFSAPTFVDPERTRVRYQLENHQRSFVDAGSHRAATFTRVPPGSYTFRVQAANADGVWNNAGAALSIELQPRLFNTLWFRVLVALGLAALATAAGILRTRRGRRRAEDLERQVTMRTRDLMRENADRQRTEAQLRDAHDHLEDKVQLRTSELADALETLRDDIERREELESQLRESQKFEALGRLAGGLAHDFNNILTAILAECDLALDTMGSNGSPGTRRREGLEAIKDAGERAARLTRQLLAYSRQQVLRPETIDPNHTIRDLEEMLRRLVREDIELRLRLSPQIGCVHVDPGQLGQVIVNLVVNASDATAGGGQITIETSRLHLDQIYVANHPDARPGRHILIAVMDSGTGMNDELVDHIFEPFFSTKEPGKGTGLGLASVHGIVKQSGGFIHVVSEPGVGTTFQVYLPAVEGVAPVDPTPAPVEQHPAADATVLLCDDEPAIRRVASLLLERVGYRVFTADSPERAMEFGRSHVGTIDLLITDLIMPGMHGTELAAQLREIRDDLRVLYISGYSPDRQVEEETGDLRTQFLNKPFNSETLIQRVAAILVAHEPR